MSGQVPVAMYSAMYLPTALQDCGWGYFGFKSCSAVGKYMAEYMATGNCPDMLKPFNLRRYENHELMGETAALVSYTPDN